MQKFERVDDQHVDLQVLLDVTGLSLLVEDKAAAVCRHSSGLAILGKYTGQVGLSAQNAVDSVRLEKLLIHNQHLEQVLPEVSSPLHIVEALVLFVHAVVHDLALVKERRHNHSVRLELREVVCHVHKTVRFLRLQRHHGADDFSDHAATVILHLVVNLLKVEDVLVVVEHFVLGKLLYVIAS